MCFPLFLQAQNVQNLGQLIDSLKSHPQSKSDEIAVEQALTAKKQVHSKLYPSVSGFGKYDHASSPTSMIPIVPNEMFEMISDETIGQPFSENIYRLGATVSMPIFMKSIYTTASMAKMMVKSAQEKAYINLLKNEAALVGFNASLMYIESMQKALESRQKSLQKTKEFVEIKVNNGRAPGTALLKINNALSDILLLLNDLNMQREQVIAGIASYTGLTLTNAVPMQQIGDYQDGEFRSLDPMVYKLKAAGLKLRAEKEKLLPSLSAQGSYSNNFAKAYNNDENVHNDYTSISVTLSIPVVAMNQYAQIKSSRLEVEATQNELNKTKLELAAQATQLQNSLVLLENSLQLYQNSIKNKQALLETAKVAYRSEQMTMEDYLKYEDDVTMEQSKMFKSQAQKWQNLVQLAVIYGNNIEQIVQ